MPLFANLNDQFFLPFSRGNRWFYEECLTRLYARFYKDAPRYPRDSEVIADIYETLKLRPDLWSPSSQLEELPELPVSGRRRVNPRPSRTAGDTELADAVRNRAVRHYEYLLATGWLEEERFGIVKTVDMSPGGLSIMETLYRIREGFALQFSGTLVQLNLALKGIADDPAANALSLNQVRQSLESFVRHLRAIISDLKRIRSEMVEGEGQRARLRAKRIRPYGGRSEQVLGAPSNAAADAPGLSRGERRSRSFPRARNPRGLHREQGRRGPRLRSVSR